MHGEEVRYLPYPRTSSLLELCLVYKVERVRMQPRGLAVVACAEVKAQEKGSLVAYGARYEAALLVSVSQLPAVLGILGILEILIPSMHFLHNRPLIDYSSLCSSPSSRH